MSKPQHNQPTLAELIDTAREATRDLRAAIKDAAQAQRDLDAKRDEFRTYATRFIGDQLTAEIRAWATDLTARHGEKWAKDLAAAVHAAEQRVIDRFDALAAHFFPGENYPDGQPFTFEDLLTWQELTRKLGGALSAEEEREQREILTEVLGLRPLVVERRPVKQPGAHVRPPRKEVNQ
jgi:hypothetical protein